VTSPSFQYQSTSPRKRTLGIALTVLVHALVLLALLWQRQMPPTSAAGSRITVLLSALSPSAPKATAPPEEKAAQPKPKPAPRKPPPPPPPDPQSLRDPLPPPPKPPEPTPEPPAPTPPPPVAQTPPMDLSEFIKQRRQGQNAPAPSEGSSAPSANDVAMANINRNLQSLTGRRPGVGGVFQILHKGTREAQFAFNGWNPGVNNQWRDVIDVDAGIGGNVELAIIRRMISLIRNHYQGNFNWESQRLGRVVVLSARMEDNAELEAFLMREFFEQRR
jgi:hypothetical protein